MFQDFIVSLWGLSVVGLSVAGEPKIPSHTSSLAPHPVVMAGGLGRIVDIKKHDNEAAMKGFVRLAVSLCFPNVIRSLLLSDLKTPCFLIDVQALEKTLASTHSDSSVDIPPVLLRNKGQKLVPTTGKTYKSPHSFDAALDPVDIFLSDLEENSKQSAAGAVCYGFIHSRVVKPRHGSYLAELDVPTDTSAHLVLGLNNHHVVSYYWARSAGTGAAMEAPGIVLKDSKLMWGSESGFTKCNSNDGKRSEWVNFLRTGDQVQLRPQDAEESAFRFGDCVFGISAQGRPLGSEPVVVCKWITVKQAN